MRPLLLLSVVTACSAPTTAPSSTPAFDHDAIIARDKLVDPSEAIDPVYEPSFDRVFAAELDGAAPREWLIVTSHPVPEAAAEVRIAPYRWDGLDWRALPTLTAGGYMESGYVEVVDLEGDRQDELLLVGDTDGVSRADLSVVRLVKDEFVDLVWGVDAGASPTPGGLAARPGVCGSSGRGCTSSPRRAGRRDAAQRDGDRGRAGAAAGAGVGQLDVLGSGTPGRAARLDGHDRSAVVPG